MSGIGITIDEVSPLLVRVKTSAAAQGLALVGARAAGSLVRDHLFALDNERHQAGRHYYAQAARSVTTAADPRGATVSITQIGLRQRLRGGPIRPRPGHALTIPVEGSAGMGHRAREFNDLDIGRVMDDDGRLRWALVRRASTPISYVRRKGKDGTVSVRVRPGAPRMAEPLFWLSRGVNQKPDPSVLPSPQKLSLVAVDAVKLRVERLGNRNHQPEGIN